MSSAATTETSVAQEIMDSLVASANIVFGMEDSTVAIFGLVTSVAASTPGSHAVLPMLGLTSATTHLPFDESRSEFFGYAVWIWPWKSCMATSARASPVNPLQAVGLCAATGHTLRAVIQ